MSSRFVMVDGALNSAIYDLERGDVFSLNQAGSRIVHQLLNGSAIVDKVAVQYLETLNALGMTSSTITLDSEIEYSSDDNSPGLYYAWLEITESCNCNCVHCYGQWGDDIKAMPSCQDKNFWFRIIDEIYQRGGRDIQFIGGEPLLHPQIVEMIEYAHKTGITTIEVFTNATLITEELVQVFKENSVSVRVSLYGHCAEIHDQVTQRHGSFINTERGLRLLKLADIPTRIAVVIMDINENYIDEIQRYIESIGYVFGGYDTIRQAVNGKQKKHCLHRIDVLEKKYQTQPKFRTDRHSFEKNHYANSCWFHKLAFAANGDVYPCIFARDSLIGNTMIDSFDTIWKRAQLPWTNGIDNIEGCKSCEFRYACRDCRPIAKQLIGSDDSQYPRCTYDPSKGVWRTVQQVTVELYCDSVRL